VLVPGGKRKLAELLGSASKSADLIGKSGH